MTICIKLPLPDHIDKTSDNTRSESLPPFDHKEEIKDDTRSKGNIAVVRPRGELATGYCGFCWLQSVEYLHSFQWFTSFQCLLRSWKCYYVFAHLINTTGEHVSDYKAGNSLWIEDILLNKCSSKGKILYFLTRKYFNFG